MTESTQSKQHLYVAKLFGKVTVFDREGKNIATNNHMWEIFCRQRWQYLSQVQQGREAHESSWTKGTQPGEFSDLSFMVHQWQTVYVWLWVQQSSNTEHELFVVAMVMEMVSSEAQMTLFAKIHPTQVGKPVRVAEGVNLLSRIQLVCSSTHV